MAAYALPGRSATPSVRITAMARRHTRITEGLEVRLTRFGADSSTASRLGAELANGDLLESSSDEIFVEITCPGGSQARLSGRFRVVILPERRTCAFNLMAGNLDFMTKEPTEVGLAGVLAGSRSTLYAVRLSGATASLRRVLVFEGEVGVTVGEINRTLRTGAQLRYDAGSLPEAEGISEDDLRASADVHASLETSKVDPPAEDPEKVYSSLFRVRVRALAEPTNPGAWAELAQEQSRLGLQDEASYSRQRAQPGRAYPETGREEDAAPGELPAPRVRVTEIVREKQGYLSVPSLSYEPAGLGGRSLVRLGMQLGGGDFLRSDSEDMIVEITCPKGSLARLRGVFRARIIPSRGECAFELQTGAIDVLANEHTGVGYYGLVARSSKGLYEVSAALLSVRVFDGEAELSRIYPTRLSAGAEFVENPKLPTASPKAIAERAFIESADLHASVEFVKARHHVAASTGRAGHQVGTGAVSRSALSYGDLRDLYSQTLRYPSDKVSGALLGVSEARNGLYREATFHLRRAALFNPLVALRGHVDLSGDWITASGEWNSQGYYALARALFDLGSARTLFSSLEASIVSRLPRVDSEAEEAAATASELNTADHMLSSDQERDCSDISRGLPGRADSVEYCALAREVVAGQREQARALALEGLRMNELDRHLQAHDFGDCTQIARISPNETAGIDSTFFCYEAAAAWKENSVDLGMAYARLGLRADRKDHRLVQAGIFRAACESLALGRHLGGQK